MSSNPAGVFISMSVPSRYVQKCAPWSMTPFRKASPWTRLPMSRPCMSVIATTIVSMRPSRTHCSSSASRGCLPRPCPSVLTGVLLQSPRDLDGDDDGPAVARPARRAALGWSGPGELAGSLLELLLDVGQLLGRALRLRTAEARPRPPEVVDEEQDDGCHHERPRDVAARREAEQDHQDDDPEDREPGDGSGPPPEAPGSMVGPLGGGCAQVDDDPVRRVQEDRADRGHDDDRGPGADDERSDGEQPRDDHDRRQ